jgi:5-methylcytosine-specific restriction endonuclease McrA
LRDLRRIYCASHREQEREYRVNHREKERAAQRTYYLTHQERHRDKNRKWLRTARGKAFVAARGHNRRSALIGISMTLDTVLELKSEYSGICPYCNQPIVKGHIDHIVPVCKGGTNDRENLVWVCRDCNLKKNNKGLLEFLLSR